MLKYLWTGIICTPDFLKSLQRRLPFIDMNRDHSQSGISQWKKKKKFTFWCHHLWTMCEHCCVNIHLWIASLNAIVPCMCMYKASLSTSTSTSTLPLAYHHVSPYVNTVWTLLCEHPSVNCFFKCIVPCMCMHKASLSTSTSTTLPLAYYHVSPSVNIVWTLLCEHPSTNCFFKSIVPCMCMYKASLSTSTSTTLPLAYHHVSPSLNIVWTLLCEHPSTNCFFKCYCTMHVHAHCKFIYIYIYYTATCISPYVTICEQYVNTTMWTSIYQLFL